MLVTISGSKSKRTSGGINVGESEHFEFIAPQRSLYVSQGNSAADGGFQLFYGRAICLETMCRGKPTQACVRLSAPISKAVAKVPRVQNESMIAPFNEVGGYLYDIMIIQW